MDAYARSVPARRLPQMHAAALIMRLPVRVRRLAYRFAYQALQVVWLITQPQLEGVEWEPFGQLVISGRRRTDLLNCFAPELHDPVLALDRGELLEARWFDEERLPSDRSPHVAAILAHVPAPRPNCQLPPTHLCCPPRTCAAPHGICG
jgi:hypothetical protein